MHLALLAFSFKKSLVVMFTCPIRLRNFLLFAESTLPTNHVYDFEQIKYLIFAKI